MGERWRISPHLLRHTHALQFGEGMAIPSMSYGELIVDFESPKAAVKSLDYIQKHLIENYPQAYARVKRYNLMYEKFPVAVEFRDPTCCAT